MLKIWYMMKFMLLCMRWIRSGVWISSLQDMHSYFKKDIELITNNTHVLETLSHSTWERKEWVNKNNLHFLLCQVILWKRQYFSIPWRHTSNYYTLKLYMKLWIVDVSVWHLIYNFFLVNSEYDSLVLMSFVFLLFCKS